MAEIAFERMLMAHETTPGTAVNPPTHYLNLMGSITPNEDRYAPEESSGTLALTTRSATVRRWCEWEASGGVDTKQLPFLLAMTLNGSVTPTTPSGATNARLWTFSRAMTSLALKSATIYTGDPNVLEWQTPYCMMDEMTIGGDASGTDGVTLSIGGQGRFWSQTAPSSAPTKSLGPLLVPGDMQFWLDTTSSIGITEIIGRVVSAELTIPTGVTYKYVASGPGGGRTFVRHGQEKVSPELVVAFELLDDDQYAIYHGNDGDTLVKARVRWPGPEIEEGFPHFVEADIWGKLSTPSWSDLEGSNRVIEFTITGHYDTTAATDLIVRVQNDKTTL